MSAGKVAPPATLPARPAAALKKLAAADPTLARAIHACGPLKMDEGRPADLHALCCAVIGQQLSTVVAATIARRFSEKYGSGRDFDVRKVLKATHEDLRAPGLSNAKASTVRAATELWTAKRLSPEKLAALPDDEIIELLTQIKGVGPWTVKMLLMFRLRRPDVLPHEDLGFRTGMRELYGLPDLPTRQEVETISAPWAPWRSIGTWYCWEWLRVYPPKRTKDPQK